MHNNYLANYELPPFPNPQDGDDEGLLCYGGDLCLERLLSAYSNGIFPWFNEDDPILWWSPNPRFVLYPQDLHISKSLKRTINKNLFEIKYNTAFVQVMIECANAKRPNTEGTWIVPEMIEAYSKLHQAGFAHSFEAWHDGELVGGGYGVAIGDIFCGESMFAKKNDASKVAFVHLVKHLISKGFSLVDSQLHTNYLEKFGAIHISRDEYLCRLKDGLLKPKIF